MGPDDNIEIKSEYQSWYFVNSSIQESTFCVPYGTNRKRPSFRNCPAQYGRVGWSAQGQDRVLYSMHPRDAPIKSNKKGSSATFFPSLRSLGVPGTPPPPPWIRPWEGRSQADILSSPGSLPPVLLPF